MVRAKQPVRELLQQCTAPHRVNLQSTQVTEGASCKPERCICYPLYCVCWVCLGSCCKMLTAVVVCCSWPPLPRAALRRLGSAASSSGISVTSARAYNYALPRLSLAKESTCVQDSSCGRFLVAGWPLPAAAEVPPGSIDRQGAVPSVASTPIRLNSNAYYLLVRGCAGWLCIWLTILSVDKKGVACAGMQACSTMQACTTWCCSWCMHICLHVQKRVLLRHLL